MSLASDDPPLTAEEFEDIRKTLIRPREENLVVCPDCAESHDAQDPCPWCDTDWLEAA